MQEAVRPHVMAGVALVGASVIAAATVSPAPDIRVPDFGPALHGSQLGLAAVTNPLEVYATVFGNAITNANTLLGAAMPGQLLEQILSNQLDSIGTLTGALGTAAGGIGTALGTEVPQLIETAAGQLAAGDIADAVNTVLQIPAVLLLPAVGDLLPALQTVLTKPLQNLQNVIGLFGQLDLETELLLSGFIAPLISTPAAAAVALQNIVTAAFSLNPLAVASAIVTAPAIVADGLLNGGYGPDLGPLVDSPFAVLAGGLLSTSHLVIGPDESVTVITGGPIDSLQQVLGLITGAITPASTATARVAQAEVASVPTEGVATFTLSTTEDDTSEEVTSAEPLAESLSADEDDVVDDTTENVTAATAISSETSAKEAESEDTTTVSTTKLDEASDEETTVEDVNDVKDVSDVKDVDVTTGNKVEPKTSADDTKTSDDHAIVSGDTTAEQTATTADSTTGADNEGSADNDSAGSDSE